MTWMDEAACRGATPTMYPSRGKGAHAPKAYARDVARAKAICAACPVTAPCLDYGLRADDPLKYGVAGGITWIERRHMRRQEAS